MWHSPAAGTGLLRVAPVTSLANTPLISKYINNNSNLQRRKGGRGGDIIERDYYTTSGSSGSSRGGGGRGGGRKLLEKGKVLALHGPNVNTLLQALDCLNGVDLTSNPDAGHCSTTATTYSGSSSSTTNNIILNSINTSYVHPHIEGEILGKNHKQLLKNSNNTNSTNSSSSNNNNNNSGCFSLYLTHTELLAVEHQIITDFHLNIHQRKVLEQCRMWFMCKGDSGGESGDSSLDGVGGSGDNNSSNIVLVHGVFGSGKSHLLVGSVYYLDLLPILASIII